MGVLSALARPGLRRRRPLLGLAAVVALGLGVAIAALEASDRTAHAYPSYLRRADVSELVVNPSLTTERAEEIIASTPGVLGYVSDSLLNAGDDREQPTKKAEVDSSATQVRMSTNGRYITHDRPVVREGRMIRSGAEAFVNAEMARALDIRVGSVMPLAFYPNQIATPARARATSSRSGGPRCGSSVSASSRTRCSRTACIPDTEC